MAERYSKLFSLPENLYAQGSPVVIAAGALLKDNVTGNVLAQLKIQNISNKPIKAVKVAITPLDSVGRLLDGEVEYQYLDLSAKRDDFFGVKTPVALPDATTRSYTIRVVEVAFGDNSLWNEAGAPWETLPKQRTLVSALGDEELAEQYKEDIGNSQSDKEPTKHKDLWLCACGAINRSGEPCHKCHKTFAELTNFDVEKLKENLEAWRKNDIYTEAEKLMKQEAYQQAINEFTRIRSWRDADAMIIACENKIKELEEKAKANALARKIKAKKARRIFVTILVLAIVGVVAYYAVPCYTYVNATMLMNDEMYEEAIVEFEKLDGFADSATKITDSKYKAALKNYQNKEYDTAISYLQSILDYSDSVDLIKQVKYAKASDALLNKNYDEAIEIFDSLAGYQNSKQQSTKALYEKSIDLYNDNKFVEAATILNELPGNYLERNMYLARSNLYNALALLEDDDFKEAYTVLRDMSHLVYYLQMDHTRYNDALAEAGYEYALSLYDVESNLEAIEVLQESKAIERGVVGAEELLDKCYDMEYEWYYSKNNFEKALYYYKISRNYDVNSDEYKDLIYKCGKQKMANNSGTSYKEAIDLFAEIESYKDSKKLMCECMYKYVNIHINSYGQDVAAKNTTVYEYLTALKKAKYNDSADIYEDLYSWKLSFAVNYTEGDYTTHKTTVSRNKTVYVHATLTGGIRYQTTKISYKVTYPNGDTSDREYFDSVWLSGWSGYVWWSDGLNSNGKYTVKFYDGDGNFIDSVSFTVS